MRLSKRTLKIFLFLLTVSLLAACSNDKRDRSRNVYRTQRNGDFGNNFMGQNGGMWDPMQQNGGQYSEWGAIAARTNNFTSILNTFMNGAELGYVSGNPYDDTGVRFTGNARSQIYILVWDEYAYQAGAYYWPMRVRDVQVQNNYARLIVDDEVGQLKFEGEIYNGIWSGVVQFNNSYSNGASGTLGEFEIAAGVIFQ